SGVTASPGNFLWSAIAGLARLGARLVAGARLALGARFGLALGIPFGLALGGRVGLAFGLGALLRAGLRLAAGLGHDLIDRALHEEGPLGDVVVLALEDLLEAADRLGDGDVGPIHDGGLGGHEEPLGPGRL